jgi:hypothetical protein
VKLANHGQPFLWDLGRLPEVYFFIVIIKVKFWHYSSRIP